MESKPLNQRQSKFVKGVIEGATLTKAAADAGYRHPDVYGSELMRKPAIQQALQTAFERQGLNADFLAEKLKELICAEDTDKDGNTVPNWPGRARGLDLLVRITGADRHPEVKASLSVEQYVLQLYDQEYGTPDENHGTMEVVDLDANRTETLQLEASR